MRIPYFLVVPPIVLGLGYTVMIFRLWKRTGTPRSFNAVPQSNLGRWRVLVLLVLFACVACFWFLT